jgi:sugar phosphate isomerase/epimerase
MNRRYFVQTVMAGVGLPRLLRAADTPLRIGVTDWNLNLGADPEAVPLAAQLGFEGVQVSFGRELVDGRMPADDPATIHKYLELSAAHRIPIDGTCVDRLHDNGLKSDPQAVKWVRDAIRLTKQLNTSVLLLPFFGRWALKSQSEMDFAGDALRDLGPEAARAGVVLGLENTISAEDNVRIMERSRSEAVKVYYDVGNSTNNGFDVVKEIRWLGKDRICQFHFKDNPHYLGEGTIPFPGVVNVIKEIGWQGFANLETDAHRATLASDMKRNLKFIKEIRSQVYSLA